MKLFVLCIVVAGLTIGCKKEKVEYLCDCSQLEDRYLVDYHSYSYDSWSSVSEYSDVVIETKVEGNNLTVDGITFVVSFDDQTVFKSTDATTGVVRTLTYSNNYQTIDLEIDGGPGGPGLTTTDRSYTGNSTTLLASVSNSSTHPYKSEIEGEYLMWYTKKALANSNENDTLYQDTFLVTMYNSSVIDINGTLYDYGPFHSNYSETDNSSSSNYINYKGIRREGDSLFILKRQILTYPGAEDTSFVNYSGKKL